MLQRCRWVTSGMLSQELIDYHDKEYSRPVHDEQLAFEYLVMELFQSGLSWQTVLKKRVALKEDFASNDIARVAAFGPEDGEKLPASTTLSKEVSAALKDAGFSFTGPVVVESLLQAVGIHNGHDQGCAWHHLMTK